MNIKQNIKTIQDQFKSDEKIFESAFKLEKIFNRYKWVLASSIIFILILWGYTKLQNILEEKNAKMASKIYAQLQQEDSPKLLEQLEQKAPQLAEFLYLKKAVENGNEEDLQKLEKSKNRFIADFAKYQKAMLKKDKNALASINRDFGDLAKFQYAFLLIQDKQITQAKEILQSIPQNSSIKDISNLLTHYGTLETISNTKEKN